MGAMVRLTHERGSSARADAAANRERILEAAREVFARRGLEAEIREIAERAGVGVGTLYRHFESRDGLLGAVVQEAKDGLLQRLRAQVDTEGPVAALTGMMRLVAELCERFGALTEAALSGRLGRLHEGEAEFTELLERLLRRGVRTGAFRLDLDVPVAASVLKSAFTAGAFLDLATQRSYAGAAEAIADFFLLAVRAFPVAEGQPSG